MRTVDGTALPYTRPDTVNTKVEILGITLSIESTNGAAYGDYTVTSTYRFTTRGHQNTISGTGNGSWTLTGTTLRLLDVDGFYAGGSINGNTMTLNTTDSRTYVYTK